MSHSGILLATGHPRRTIVNNCFDKYSNVIFGCVVVFVILNFTVLRMAEEIFFSYFFPIIIQQGRLIFFLFIIFINL